MANEDGFDIKEWEEFVENFAKFVDKWEAKKAELLKRMALLYYREVKPLVPVDTSRLVDSIYIFDDGIPQDYVEVGTNVEYALYVNDGHVQHKRFLPIRYISAGGKKVLVSKYGAQRKGKKGGIAGIMLSERYVQGKFFFENAKKASEPHWRNAVYSFMEECAREVEGGRL